jgi:hypothetical protein
MRSGPEGAVAAAGMFERASERSMGAILVRFGELDKALMRWGKTTGGRR